MGNARNAVVTCISYSLSNKKSVRMMDDRTHACYLSLGRWREPPYLGAMCLGSP